MKNGDRPKEDIFEFVFPYDMQMAFMREAFGLMACSQTLPSFLQREISISARRYIRLRVENGVYAQNPGDGPNHRIDIAAVALSHPLILRERTSR